MIRQNMKKTICCIVMLIISSTLLLSGCIKIDISTGIEADFTSYLSYRIEMDVSDIEPLYRGSLRNALNGIGWHYQEELGFIVELSAESDLYVLTLTRRIANESIEKAYESLEYLLTNEDITVFMMVDMAFQSSERQNIFVLSAEADIPQILRISNAEELQPTLQEHLLKAMETGEGTITLTLPASELVYTSHHASIKNDHAVMVVPLSFTNKTGIEISGVINRLKDGSSGGPLEEIIRELTMYRNIAIMACGAIAILMLIILLSVNLAKKKKAEY